MDGWMDHGWEGGFRVLDRDAEPHFVTPVRISGPRLVGRACQAPPWCRHSLVNKVVNCRFGMGWNR